MLIPIQDVMVMPPFQLRDLLTDSKLSGFLKFRGAHYQLGLLNALQNLEATHFHTADEAEK